MRTEREKQDSVNIDEGPREAAASNKDVGKQAARGSEVEARQDSGTVDVAVSENRNVRIETESQLMRAGEAKPVGLCAHFSTFV